MKRDPGWTYEGIAFYVLPTQNGQCPVSPAIYRAYNNRYAANDSSHRFATHLIFLTNLQSQGWTVEGIAFCAAKE